MESDEERGKSDEEQQKGQAVHTNQRPTKPQPTTKHAHTRISDVPTHTSASHSSTSYPHIKWGVIEVLG